MDNKSKYWCFTLNNPVIGVDADSISRLVAEGIAAYVVIGHERGEGGTPHFQGYVEFVNRKRLTQAKLLIGTRAHLERRRGTAEEARAYCIKDGVFEEFGHFDPDQRPGSRRFPILIL